LPLETGSVDVAAAIHVLEHFAEWEAEGVLREWQRILKPGGLLVLELPSMDKIVAYLIDCVQKQGGKINMQLSWWGIYGDPRYHDAVMVHKWGYTKAMLRAVLETVGGWSEINAEPPRYHMKRRDMRMTARKALA
jgi:predicted SAM-dependent methyltransferase